MTWSNLETHFQEGEATQALITREDDAADASQATPPRVLTAGCGDHLALVIDHNIHVFGAKGKETQFSVKLKTKVVALSWVEVSIICAWYNQGCGSGSGQPSQPVL